MAKRKYQWSKVVLGWAYHVDGRKTILGHVWQGMDGKHWFTIQDNNPRKDMDTVDPEEIQGPINTLDECKFFVSDYYSRKDELEFKEKEAKKQADLVKKRVA